MPLDNSLKQLIMSRKLIKEGLLTSDTKNYDTMLSDSAFLMKGEYCCKFIHIIDTYPKSQLMRSAIDGILYSPFWYSYGWWCETDHIRREYDKHRTPNHYVIMQEMLKRWTS